MTPSEITNFQALMKEFPDECGTKMGTKLNRNFSVASDLNKNHSTRLLPPERTEAMKAFVNTVKPIRHLSFFERQTAKALGKSVDAHGNINLAENSSGATGQSVNRNFKPATMSAEEIFHKGTANTETSSLGHQVTTGSVAKCKRYCYVPGRNCPNCLGHGYDWAQKQEKSRMRKALNKSQAAVGFSH